VKRWEPDFDFWHAVLEETSAHMFLDMAAAQHAPLASHPVRLQVRLALLEPREDGLLAESEAEAVHGVEDRVTTALAESLDAVFVGRLVAEGRATLAFYLPRASEPRADAEVKKLAGESAPYFLQWRTEEDAAWAYYFELLYPDDESKKEMMSRRAADRILGVGN
jgi:hypothetical protein